MQAIAINVANRKRCGGPALERLLHRACWPMRKLGPPTMIGGTLHVAVVLPADRASFQIVWPDGYRSGVDSFCRWAP